MDEDGYGYMARKEARRKAEEDIEHILIEASHAITDDQREAILRVVERLMDYMEEVL